MQKTGSVDVRSNEHKGRNFLQPSNQIRVTLLDSAWALNKVCHGFFHRISAMNTSFTPTTWLEEVVKHHGDQLTKSSFLLCIITYLSSQARMCSYCVLVKPTGQALTLCLSKPKTGKAPRFLLKCRSSQLPFIIFLTQLWTESGKCL